MELVAKAIGSPEHLKPFAMIACGYPAETRNQENRFDEKRIHYIN